MLRDAVAYLVAQNKLVEPLYEMEKSGQLSGEGDKGMEGRSFLEGQIVKGGQMLGNIWLTAWLEAPADTYLQKTASTADSRRTQRKSDDKMRPPPASPPPQVFWQSDWGRLGRMA